MVKAKAKERTAEEAKGAKEANGGRRDCRHRSDQTFQKVLQRGRAGPVAFAIYLR